MKKIADLWDGYMVLNRKTHESYMYRVRHKNTLELSTDVSQTSNNYYIGDRDTLHTTSKIGATKSNIPKW